MRLLELMVALAFAAAAAGEVEDEVVDGEADADSGSCRMAASERAFIHWIMDWRDSAAK